MGCRLDPPNLERCHRARAGPGWQSFDWHVCWNRCSFRDRRPSGIKAQGKGDSARAEKQMGNRDRGKGAELSGKFGELPRHWPPLPLLALLPSEEKAG